MYTFKNLEKFLKNRWQPCENQKGWEIYEAQIPKQVIADPTKINTSKIQSCDHCHQCELTISCCKLK